MLASTQNTAQPIIKSILGEFKYRVLYTLLLLAMLIGLIYLNLGLYLEFNRAYYLGYYQFIDFNWSSGVVELNESLSCSHEKSPVGIRLESSSNTVSESVSDEVQQAATVKFTLSNGFAGAKPLVKNFYLLPLVEIDEYRHFFISAVSFFAGGATASSERPINDSLGSVFAERAGRFENTGNFLWPTFDGFSLYLVLVFYQLIAILSYQAFCFWCPAVIQKLRLQLGWYALVLFTLLLLHCLMLPSVLALFEEFQIESLDSELFQSVNFDLQNSWIKCFYFLLFPVSAISGVIFLKKRLIK